MQMAIIRQDYQVVLLLGRGYYVDDYYQVGLLGSAIIRQGLLGSAIIRQGLLCRWLLLGRSIRQCYYQEGVIMQMAIIRQDYQVVLLLGRGYYVDDYYQVGLLGSAIIRQELLGSAIIRQGLLCKWLLLGRIIRQCYYQVGLLGRIIRQCYYQVGLLGSAIIRQDYQVVLLLGRIIRQCYYQVGVIMQMAIIRQCYYQVGVIIRDNMVYLSLSIIHMY